MEVGRLEKEREARLSSEVVLKWCQLRGERRFLVSGAASTIFRRELTPLHQDLRDSLDSSISCSIIIIMKIANNAKSKI